MFQKLSNIPTLILCKILTIIKAKFFFIKSHFFTFIYLEIFKKHRNKTLF